MVRTTTALGIRIAAIFAAAAGATAVGLLATPIASGEPAQCPQGQFPTSDGTGCAGVPDPTKYGCPPKDFKCMFESMPKH
jgi:hypothetical protein